MEIERIARKLEPLMPNQVQQWMRARDTADPETKNLIEKQIISSAYQKLGDFRRKILLSLPPKSMGKGAFNLGAVVYENPKWPVAIKKSELMQNMAIFGRSGAGKTNVAFHLLEQLEKRNIPFIFLDWKRTARHLLPYLKSKVNVFTPGRSLLPFVFNPFIPPPGIEPNVYLNQVIDVLAEAYTLGDGARSILQKALHKLYKQTQHYPTVNDVLAEVENTPQKGRAGGWKVSAVRALESLAFSQATTNSKVSQEQLVRTLLKENTIVELDALGQSTKKFLVPLLCLWLYYVKLTSSGRENLDLVIFVEEAHHVMSKQEGRSTESVMNMLLRQCREIGIGMIIIDQHPHLTSSAVLGNTYTSICLNQKNPADINKAAGISQVDNEEKGYFSILSVGQGIVKLQDRWIRPFLVQFPLVKVKKGMVTDTLLAGQIRRNNSGSARKTSVLTKFGQVPRFPLFDDPLDESAFAFINDILEYPGDGVKLRYLRLGLSTGRGNRLKEQLLSQDWLEAQVVDLGRTRKVLLRLSSRGRETLGLDGKDPEHGSLVHEYWKRFYVQRFQEMGYRATLESPRRSGNVDVLAVKNGKAIAIEIETGKSDVVRNVRQDLLSGFDKVVVVATDNKALGKVEGHLAEAGLIMPGRVDVVFRDRIAGVFG